MRFSLLLIPLLALTLGLRFAVGAGATAEDRERFLADSVAVLHAAGFSARIERRRVLDAVVATQGNCRIVVTAETWSGNRVGVFRQRHAAGLQLSMFHRDQLVSGYPRLRPTLDFYTQRHLASLGLAVAYRPVILIGHTPQCDLRVVDWQQLQMHPDPGVSALPR